MSYRPQVTEATFQKKRVLIDPRKQYADAFKNPSIYLYLPTDQLGNPTCPTKACRMECWTPKPDITKGRPSSIFLEGGISHTLIKLEGDEVYVTLAQSVALGTIGVLNKWLTTLVRTPDNDLYSFEVFIGQGGL
jgi:hypothetical protein